MRRRLSLGIPLVLPLPVAAQTPTRVAQALGSVATGLMHAVLTPEKRNSAAFARAVKQLERVVESLNTLNYGNSTGRVFVRSKKATTTET